MNKELKELKELAKNNGFKVGDVAYTTYGLGDFTIKPFRILKLERGMATVKIIGTGETMDINTCMLIRDRDVIQEVFDFIKINGGIND